MKNVYILKINNKSIAYSSLDALFTAHGDELGVTKSWIYKALTNSNIYPNKKVPFTIEKMKVFTKTDVLENKHL